MISYTFNDNTKIPIYEQLYIQIKNDILSGKLSANKRLPSKRNFANQLSISVITVENAYNQLLSEGFIYSLPRKGFYVSEIFKESYELADRRKANNTDDSTHTVFYYENSKDASHNDERQYFADFSSNATDPSSFPFSTWAKLTRRILSDDQSFLMKNSPSNGIFLLRDAIASYLQAYRGINVSPDSIIIGAGTETMYNILIQLIGHHRIYACEKPGYKKISEILNANEVENLQIPMDESGVIPSELEKNGVNIIHTTPSHHFPTGITMPVKRRYELLSWATSAEDRYIIEDDYDSEFRLSGRPIPALFSTDTNGKIIYMNTFTKSLASTIRISYMILPPELLNKYYQRLSFYSCTVSTFEQLTLAHFISEGYYEKHINRMRTAYRKKRDYLLSCIKDSGLGNISEINEEQSGLHFILKLKLKIPEEKFLKNLEENDIHIVSTAPQSYMINYSSIPLNKISEAINRINAATNK